MNVCAYTWLGKYMHWMLNMITDMFWYRCITLLVPPDDLRFMKTVRKIYQQQEKYAQALNMSIRMRDMDLIREDFESAPDRYVPFYYNANMM